MASSNVKNRRPRANKPLRGVGAEYLPHREKGGRVMKRATILEGTILTPDVVASDYYILRVKHYERQYNLGWGEFLGGYESKRIDCERTNRDFFEWAFLCRTFSSELIQLEANGPPGNDSSVSCEKPESVSGFCFGL
jgi:hypothetical protein